VKERIVKILVVFGLILLLDTCTGAHLTLIVLQLISGWAFFIARIPTRIHWRWETVISIAIYSALLILGSHYFARWLYRELRGVSNNPASPGRWKWTWTLRFFTLFILLFAAGTAAVAMTHQTAWLVTSPEPHFAFLRTKQVDRIYCSRQLKDIGYALDEYAKAHDGRLPDDLQQLIEHQHILSHEFVCPSTNLQRATGPTTREIADNARKPEHCSYIYRGKGLMRPLNAEFVIVYERADVHAGDGMNLLFADGNVLWVAKDEVQHWLDKPSK
jgi:prepilin-type processing-associated H-X9-DG protein